MAAARFVDAGRADQHAVAAGDEPLRVIRGIAADDADGERLGDVFGNRQKLRHRLERPAEVVLVQTGHDHAFAAVRQLLQAAGRFWSKNCPSSMPTTSVSRPSTRKQLVRAAHGGRRDPHVAVRDDVIVAVAIVDERLEDLDVLAGDLRAAQPPDQLLALAAEHAAGDDLDPAVAEAWCVS